MKNEQKEYSAIEKLYQDLQSANEGQTEHLELAFAPQNSMSSHTPLKQRAANKSRSESSSSSSSAAFAAEMLAPIHSYHLPQTMGGLAYGSLIPFLDTHSQSFAYMDMSRDSGKDIEHLELMNPLDPFSLEKTLTPKSTHIMVTTATDRSAPLDTGASDFTSSLLQNSIHSSSSTEEPDAFDSYNLLQEYNVQAQVYAEMSNPAPQSHAAQHIELLAMPAQTEKKSAFEGMVPFEAVEVLRFKRFFLSLLREIKADPEVTLTQISQKLGQVINPFTGKPAGQEFFFRLLKEARKLSLKAMRKPTASKYGYPPSIRNSEKEMVKAISQILSNAGSDQFTSNTDSLLPETLNSLGIPMTFAKL